MNAIDIWQMGYTSRPQIIVLTGDIGVGKTTLCRALIDAVHVEGWRVHGLWSPGVFVGGVKVAIDVLDLGSGDRRQLAIRRTIPDENSPTSNWQFDPVVLNWADAVLGAIETTDLLVIDELGQLELRHASGWRNALPLLARQEYAVACVVVRHWLVDDFLSHFHAAKVIHVGHPNDHEYAP